MAVNKTSDGIWYYKVDWKDSRGKQHQTKKPVSYTHLLRRYCRQAGCVELVALIKDVRQIAQSEMALNALRQVDAGKNLFGSRTILIRCIFIQHRWIAHFVPAAFFEIVFDPVSYTHLLSFSVHLPFYLLER